MQSKPNDEKSFGMGAFHEFYMKTFGEKRWTQLYNALLQPTLLVSVTNPTLPSRWIAKELKRSNASPSTVFSPEFTKGIGIFELPETANEPLQDSMRSEEDASLVSRWPVKLPRLGQQPGDIGSDFGFAYGHNNPNNHPIDVTSFNNYGGLKDRLGWYLMDLASIAAPLILNPQPGEKVLDLCAAPGGKSLILAYLLFCRDFLEKSTEETKTALSRQQTGDNIGDDDPDNTAAFRLRKKFPHFVSYLDPSPFPQSASEPQQQLNDPSPEPSPSQDVQHKYEHLTHASQPNHEFIMKVLRKHSYLIESHPNLLSLNPQLNTIYHNFEHELTMINQSSAASLDSDEVLQLIRDSMAAEQNKEQPQDGNVDKNDESLLDDDHHDQSVIKDSQIEQLLLKELKLEREMRLLHLNVMNPHRYRQDEEDSIESGSVFDNNDEGSHDENSEHDNNDEHQTNDHHTDKSLHAQVKLLLKKARHEQRVKYLEQRKDQQRQHDIEQKRNQQAAIQQQSLIAKSRLILNDVSSSRVKRLKQVIQGYIPMRFTPFIEITNIDASTAQAFTSITRRATGDVNLKKQLKSKNKSEPGEFDCVLVDAPCSSDRHIIHHNALANWNVGQTKQQAKRQTSLLVAALKSLNIGGRCVYSTCSLSPYENDGVVQHAIKQMGGNEVIKIIKFKLAIGERTPCGWILLPDQPGCEWGPLYMSLLQRIS